MRRRSPWRRQRKRELTVLNTTERVNEMTKRCPFTHVSINYFLSTCYIQHAVTVKSSGSRARLPYIYIKSMLLLSCVSHSSGLQGYSCEQDKVSALMEFPFYLEVSGVQTIKTTTTKNKKIAAKC